MKACVDIGGTKISVCLTPDGSVGADGLPSLLHRRSASTPRAGTRDALARMVIALVNAACVDAGITRSALTAVGVASCGPFVRVDGQIELAA